MSENFPKGWALRKEFIDPATGDKYEKGVLIEKGDGEAVTPSETPETQTMSPEVFALQQQINDLKRHLQRRDETPASITVQKEKVPFGEYDDSRIPDLDNDFISPPIQYVKHGRGYSLSSYMRDGKQVLAPHNIPIYFNREFDEVTYHDGNAKIIPFCQFVCHSRADAEFIENSPQYGATIYKGLQNAKNIDLEMVDKYEGAVISVQRMTDEQLMANCMSRKMDVRKPKNQLRAQLIKVMMTDYIKQEESLLGKRQEDMRNEVMSPPTT